MRSVFLWVFMGVSANAQELPFDPAPLDDCVAVAEVRVDALACVGMAAEACTEAPGGYTTVGMSACYGMEREHWDRRLNTAFKALMRHDKDLDSSMASGGLALPPLAPALRDMQRAWIAYRDAACAYERAQWGGGTGQGPATAACLMQLTAEQALNLEARLAEVSAR